MGRPLPFHFEPAPELPGSDRLSRYLFGSIRSLLPRLWDFAIEGREHVPLDGPAIIAPNHLSFCDSVFVPGALPRRVWAIGKGEYLDSLKTNHLFPAMGMIPVDRTGGEAAQAALDTAARVLDAGRLFMIYPEGTRSRDAHLHKGRTGAARLSIRCDAPIVPCGHAGTLLVQPPDTFAMKPGKRVVVRFGAPMWASDHGDPEDPRTLRRFTDAVMFEISQLSGQRYVDEYAGAPAVDSGERPTTPDEQREARDVAPTRPKIAIRRPEPARSEPESNGPAPDTEHARVTPRRPSVVGDHSVDGAPAAIPVPADRRIRPPSDRPSVPQRPGADDELVGAGTGADTGAGPQAITVPSGRRRD